MAHRMTVDHDNLFSAAGVVANYNHQTPPTGATTPYPVPTHVIIGNNDQFVAKALGKTVPMSMNVSSSLFDAGSPLVSAAPNYAFYHNNSTTRTQKYTLGSPVPFPFIGIDITYPPLDPNKDGTYKILYYEGLNHAWPRRFTYVLPWGTVLPAPSTLPHIDATNYFWNFFITSNSNLQDCTTNSAKSLQPSSNVLSFDKTIILKLAPNPTSGIFTVNFSELQEQAVINIFDATGKLVQQKTVQNRNSIQLEINGSKGLYFIETILYNGQKEVIKLIKS